MEEQNLSIEIEKLYLHNKFDLILYNRNKEITLMNILIRLESAYLNREINDCFTFEKLEGQLQCKQIYITN